MRFLIIALQSILFEHLTLGRVARLAQFPVAHGPQNGLLDAARIDAQHSACAHTVGVRDGGQPAKVTDIDISRADDVDRATPAIVDAVRTADERGVRRLSPFTVPAFLVNLAAGQVAIRHGFKGPLGAPVTACAAGVQAIGDAARLLLAGEADVAIAGGAEACIDRVSLGGFAAARALSTNFNDQPQRASRPFDRDRDGFVMGEGAGLVVIETLDHALSRGATPIAELVGYGTTSDAYHMTAGPEDGDGARRAIEIALRQAGISPLEVQHLNAHATSTPVGDNGELAAIKAVFGTEGKVAVSSTKSATGHLLGAAGGLEAIFSVLALRDQIAPATLNLDHPDAAAEGVDLVRGAARPMTIEHVLSNGFGFGGVNASVLFRAW